MGKNAILKKFKIKGKRVKLFYSDYSSLHVRKVDFDRVFQCMVSCPKHEIKRDFAISRWQRV